MRKRYDMLLGTLKSMVPFWNIMIFSYVWVLFYNEQTFSTFWSQGAVISVFIYIVVYLAFGNLYHAFKIGTYRTTEIIFSQLLAFGIADFCLYLVSCLIHRGFLNLIPGMLAVLAQLVGSTMLVLLVKHYFARFVPPQRTLIVYGTSQADGVIQASVEEFAEKLRRKLSHMFWIEELCEDSLTIRELAEKAEGYETVILYNVAEAVRVTLLALCVERGKNVYLTPRIEDILLTNFENRHMIDTPLLKTKNENKEYTGKRVLDVSVSALMLLLFSPFMLLIAVCIKLEDGGDIFYRQKRVTMNGKSFEILKFRSMIQDAEKQGFKPCTSNDDRITRVGRVIRATRLDETPQLINILKGDMSIVGPRPERVEHVEKYTAELPEFSYRLRVRGGLTGYAQIYGKYNTSAEDKLKMDLMYIERQSFLLDLQLIFLTVKIMFIPESTEGFKENALEVLQKK